MTVLMRLSLFKQVHAKLATMYLPRNVYRSLNVKAFTMKIEAQSSDFTQELSKSKKNFQIRLSEPDTHLTKFCSRRNTLVKHSSCLAHGDAKCTLSNQNMVFRTIYIQKDPGCFCNGERELTYTLIQSF